MGINAARLRAYLKEFNFRSLFIEEMGWDRYASTLDVATEDQKFTLAGIAEKRGLIAFTCPPQANGGIPNYVTRRKIEAQVAKSAFEHIIIYTDVARTTQIWQWVRREPGKPAACREHTYHINQPGDALIQKLEAIVFSLEEEEPLTTVAVAGRVRVAFDIERVTKRFYDRFKTEHAQFLKFIQGIPDEEMKRWYASVMINRLMFIYFIQKKGFLNNDRDYLRTKLHESKRRGKDLYYSGFLSPLFFKGFAEKERSDATERLLGKVPYLNGGLFLKHQIEEQHGKSIEIRDSAFEKLFSFFDGYQWHLDERPLRRDNEINPDVLGYIFEKYINQKQMGAYYTKEDITEYISKNTVIPFLFERAREKCKIAFEGEHSLWQLLQLDPDRYIYKAVRHGVTWDIHGDKPLDSPHELPAEIAEGLDTSKPNLIELRKAWNKPAPPHYSLPTEIWREVVARRNRYQEIRAKLAAGEVREINDLITYNLDIRQFAQDVIENSEGPDLLNAFWHATEKVTVLDPACGSGAFLFAALNILEPLYEACLDRMEAFLDEWGESGKKLHPNYHKLYSRIRKRLEDHPNRRYFILKSVIINNLFGVDIMEEATEICKLRLFLKLVAQVERDEQIEPLPDIDFNIRAGNTLVGYATYDDVKRAVGGKLDFEDAMSRIEERAQDVDRLFALFRQQQTELGGEVTPEDKNELRQRLKILEDELNAHLSSEYGVKSLKSEMYRSWLSSHKPFHWFIEFHGIMKNGGFVNIIGNPPYVEYTKVKGTYTIDPNSFKSGEANNLYAFFLERSCSLLESAGWFGMIVPAGLLGLDDARALREVLLSRYSHSFASSNAIRPSKLFEGVDQRLCIYLGESSSTRDKSVFTTRYHHWTSEERPALFSCLNYTESFLDPTLGRIPKLGDLNGLAILKKLDSISKVIASYYSRANGYLMHYHRSPRYWIRATDFEQYFKSETRSRSVHHFRDLHFTTTKAGKIAGAVLNSSLFFFWFIAMGNGRNLTGTDVERFPIGDISNSSLRRLPDIFDRLMEDYQTNSFVRVRQDCEFQEFQPSLSKSIMDEIDSVLAKQYGFTEEELDFIINYDIKYRMGLTGEQEDGE